MNILADVTTRAEFRAWLAQHHATERECWVAALKSARCWSRFRSFPPLYQRVRSYNVAFYKTRDPRAYERALANLIAHTRRGELFGEWNDYGRLLG
ncbi:MAG: hypothetical protein IJI88_08005 [Atopobiaceae bacterium]|nr:hypothetical protein [Atopobiaceae bacterium]